MSSRKGNILVIDDVRGVRRTIKAILSKHGYSVTEAENGAQGIELARQTPPDVIITDIIMPDMDGIDTIETLRRSDGEVSHAKILAVSGGGSLVDVDDALSMAARMADDTLRKPFETDELLGKVNDLMGAKQ